MTQIKERPILFSAEMVRAILGGRKTQTRRVGKPVRHPDLGNMYDIDALALEQETAREYGLTGRTGEINHVASVVV